jgi:hypothetical protein
MGQIKGYKAAKRAFEAAKVAEAVAIKAGNADAIAVAKQARAVAAEVVKKLLLDTKP